MFTTEEKVFIRTLIHKWCCRAIQDETKPIMMFSVDSKGELHIIAVDSITEEFIKDLCAQIAFDDPKGRVIDV
jgi:hypothetical protein